MFLIHQIGQIIQFVSDITQYIIPFLLGFIILFPKKFYQFLGDHLKEGWRRETEILLQEMKMKLPQTDEFYKDHYALVRDVWKLLNRARNTVAELWQEASYDNAIQLGDALLELAELVNENELLLSDDHLKKLGSITTVLLDFQAGKIRLADMRDLIDEDNYNSFEDHIKDQIASNRELMDEFDSLLSEIRKDFRNTVSSLS